MVNLESLIFSQAEGVVHLQQKLTAARALGPENGGQGEAAKARVVEEFLGAAGISDIQFINSPDERVESGSRPNIIASINGISKKRLWLFGHMDVVPPGEPTSWQTDPWLATRLQDYLYGRGVEDNQQAITSMLVLAKALHENGIIPQIGLGLVFMADEECGSRHGLDYILRYNRALFAPYDYYIVPDGGSSDASMIDIAEKAQLWLKFTVVGRQAHASLPQLGTNSLVAASHLIIALGQLKEIFPLENPIFNPPVSTFVPTKYMGNVDAINIMPGKETFFMDCRLLPGIEPDAVIGSCQEIAGKIAKKQNVEIVIEVIQKNPATETPPDAQVVRALTAAIEAVYGIKPRLSGIGGATVAALLRKAGLPAVVWSCIENTCHQANERSSITATLKDAAVFGHILLDPAA